MSQGEFVIFANCDDDCDPRMIERLVASLQANPTAGIAFCRSTLVDEHDKVLGDDYRIREQSFQRKCAVDTLIPRPEMARFLLHSCVIPNLSAALFRKECFANVGLLSSAYRVCCDWDLFFRVVTKYDVSYVAEPLNHFRQHGTTIRSVTKEKVVYEEYFRLLLGQMKVIGLTSAERSKYRLHVMKLWSEHLVNSTFGGVKNFPYHLGRVIDLDAGALPWLLPALGMRILRIMKARI
jgi:hypothetical protein